MLFPAFISALTIDEGSRSTPENLLHSSENINFCRLDTCIIR